MKRYTDISYGVERAVREGRNVLFIDLQEKKIMNAAEMTLETFVKADADDTGRFQFFAEVEEGDTDGDDTV